MCWWMLLFDLKVLIDVWCDFRLYLRCLSYSCHGQICPADACPMSKARRFGWTAWWKQEDIIGKNIIVKHSETLVSAKERCVFNLFWYWPLPKMCSIFKDWYWTNYQKGYAFRKLETAVLTVPELLQAVMRCEGQVPSNGMRCKTASLHSLALLNTSQHRFWLSKLSGVIAMERDCNPRARCICTAAGFAAFVPWPKENKVLASFPAEGDDMPKPRWSSTAQMSRRLTTSLCALAVMVPAGMEANIYNHITCIIHKRASTLYKVLWFMISLYSLMYGFHFCNDIWSPLGVKATKSLASVCFFKSGTWPMLPFKSKQRTCLAQKQATNLSRFVVLTCFQWQENLTPTSLTWYHKITNL